ncbi:MAG: tetratricopeptide repeat protein [Aureliella sp.]
MNSRLALFLAVALASSGCNGNPFRQAPSAAEEQHVASLENNPEPQLAAADALVKKFPNNGRVYAMRSMIHSRLGHTEQQMRDLDAAIRFLSGDPKQKPLLVESIYARGLAHQAASDDAAAVDDFDKVLELSPSYSTVYEARAFSYLRLKRLDEALADIDKAIEAAPENANAYELRSRIREALNDPEGAKADREQYDRMLHK